MPTDDRRWSVWPTIFAGVVLLILFAGAYGVTYWMVVKRVLRDEQSFMLPAELDAGYPHKALRPFFAPAHWIDRLAVRPKMWEPLQ